ncbi:MAG: SDR family NAD(P)-dependent oxidoreductase [Planctomycetota bacterium]|jgi:NAD(P)-dependent dehydrogenase (short-subunit alcohol dehydrogenase family)
MELEGTTAVITGSSGQLGGCIAMALAAAGCRCVCHYNRNQKGAGELVEEICKSGYNAVMAGADLAEAGGAQKLFEGIEGEAPRVLINSAAFFSRQALEDVTFESARQTLDLNLIASILTSRAFARGIPDADSPKGKIINIADVGGIRPWAQYVLYCSSKAGLIGATKALAKELAPAVCVNAVAPGIVTWPGDFDEGQKKKQLDRIPLGRVAEIREITAAVVFLLKNDYITGQVLNVDGGRNM